VLIGGVFTSPASHLKGLLTGEQYVRTDICARINLEIFRRPELLRVGRSGYPRELEPGERGEGGRHPKLLAGVGVPLSDRGAVWGLLRRGGQNGEGERPFTKSFDSPLWGCHAPLSRSRHEIIGVPPILLGLIAMEPSV